MVINQGLLCAHIRITGLCSSNMAMGHPALLFLLQHNLSVKSPDAAPRSVPTESTEALHADCIALPLREGQQARAL